LLRLACNKGKRGGKLPKTYFVAVYTECIIKIDVKCNMVAVS
jgi:hypothetical protein